MDRTDCRTVGTRPLPKGWYVHPNAKKVGSCYDGCCDEYECPDCGSDWRVEYAD